MIEEIEERYKKSQKEWDTRFKRLNESIRLDIIKAAKKGIKVGFIIGLSSGLLLGAGLMYLLVS